MYKIIITSELSYCGQKLSEKSHVLYDGEDKKVTYKLWDIIIRFLFGKRK